MTTTEGTPPHSPNPLCDDLRLALDRMPAVLRLHCPPTAGSADRPRGSISLTPPGSKSLTNRVLLLAALADGTSTVHRPLLEADDARVMLSAIARLGARVEHAAPETLAITGVRGRWCVPTGGITLDLHNAGTATRFLTAAALLADPGSAGITIDGNARMRERPIRELTDALRTLGGTVEHTGRDGYPPARVHPVANLKVLRNRIDFGRTASSQFISALLLIGPWLPNGLTVRFGGRDDATEAEVTSETYIRMTTALLRRCGGTVKGEPPGPVTVFPSDAPTSPAMPPRPGLPAFTYAVEPDASGATYWWAAGALLPGVSIRVPGLSARPGASLQGDTQLVGLLARMGAEVDDDGASLAVRGPARLGPIDADLRLMPDAAMTLAVVCAFAEPTPENPSAVSTLRGLRTLRVKETDRLEALKCELTKIGAWVEIIGEEGRHGTDESLRITPSRKPADDAVVFDTYDDHRMAMALALVSLRRGGVAINDPACVAKTYPTYWRDFAVLSSGLEARRPA